MPDPSFVRKALVALLAAAGLAGIWTWSRRDIPSAPDAATRTRAAESGAAASPRITAYPRPGPGLNLLALEPSPYLQLHARNPVDWYAWGDAAFERARAENKPVFLSVGYSTCYWCHVMERNVFSDTGIAAFMNAHFIAIKVDREERSDIDDVYMLATQILTGSGGWPNSVFLTPDGRPFFAGTYFPPEDGAGRPGFPRVLAEIHRTWSTEREKVEGTADRVTERIGALADPTAHQSMEAPPIEESMNSAIEGLTQSYDTEHGGFSRGIKFPRPPALELLMTSVEKDRNPARLALLMHTLDEMALGGIHDHLGGGFHRYATEPTWSVPHFEKMLYDNAQLVGVYAHAWALTRKPLYRRIVEETVRYLEREMSLPEGGYASAQDAEVEGEEGASYTWRRDEIEAVLGPERAKEFFAVYQLIPTRENPGVGVLRVQLSVETASASEHSRGVADLLARFDADRAALLEARGRRPQPLRDDKALVAWNALAIRGLVQAARALDQPAYLERASRTAHFLLARLRAEDGSLHRSYIAGQAREKGMLDDYAFLADALLALYSATDEPVWIAEARRLVDTLLARFGDPQGGGLFSTAEGQRLLVRLKPFDEGEMPSGNAVAFRALQSLARLTGEARYAEAASGIAASAVSLLRASPSALPTMIVALSQRDSIELRAPRIAGSNASQDDSSDFAPARSAFRLPRGEDHVRAAAAFIGDARGEFAVRLTIDPGWHVHANPASLPFLLATEVDVGVGAEGIEVRYPEGHDLRSGFVRESIRVYDGEVEIPVRLPPGVAPPARVALRFQACDEARCLPPSRTELLLEGPR